MPQSEIARKHLHPMDSTAWRLPASTDTLARILDLVEDAIISVDREQQIVLFNQAAERVFGYAAGEIRGQTLDALLPSGRPGSRRARRGGPQIPAGLATNAGAARDRRPSQER